MQWLAHFTDEKVRARVREKATIMTMARILSISTALGSSHFILYILLRPSTPVTETPLEASTEH